MKHKCKDCKHKQKMYSRYAHRPSFLCGHPDQQYIRDYCQRNGILKMPGFICYGTIQGELSIKNCPKFCPLLVEGVKKDEKSNY